MPASSNIGMSIGIRTLWIGLRAVNYTHQAFQQVINSTNQLIIAEKNLQINSLRLTQAGALFMALGFMATTAIGQIMKSSAEGAKAMQIFENAMSRATSKLGDALARLLTPALTMLANILDKISSNRALMDMMAIFIVIIPVVITLGGAMMLVSGVMGSLPNIAKIATLALQKFGIIENSVTISSNQLATALAAATAGFTLFLMLGEVLGPKVGAIIAAIAALTMAFWALFIAESVSTLGVAAAIGAGAAAAALAIQSSMEPTSYQMGTRMAQRTGLALVEKGEVLFNPNNGLPTQVGRDLNTPTAMEQNVTIDMSGTTIQTKMDKEELMPWLKKELRKTLLSKE